MKFRMVADVIFEANNMEDAYDTLANHFIALFFGSDSDLVKTGEIEVKQLETNAEIEYSAQKLQDKIVDLSIQRAREQNGEK